jgi:hypothetical protein
MSDDKFAIIRRAEATRFKEWLSVLTSSGTWFRIVMLLFGMVGTGVFYICMYYFYGTSYVFLTYMELVPLFSQLIWFIVIGFLGILMGLGIDMKLPWYKDFYRGYKQG